MSQNGVVVWEVSGRLGWETWCQKVRDIGLMRKKLPWYVGDLIVYGETNFHEKASQMLNEFGYNEKQLAQYRWVSEKFPPEERCDLKWSWHQAAAGLPKRERDKALTMALKGEINREGIRALAKAARNGKNGSGGDSVAMAGIPDEVELAENELAAIFMDLGACIKSRRKGVDCEERELGLLDALIAQAMALREKLAG